MIFRLTAYEKGRWFSILADTNQQPGQQRKKEKSFLQTQFYFSTIGGESKYGD